MVAYSFKPGFLPAIRTKVKQQTIRLPRKRHARAGEALQLFFGPRMRPVRVGSALCQSSREVRLDFGADEVVIADAIIITGRDDLDAFATRDGFSTLDLGIPFTNRPWEYMRRWWRITHPDQSVFLGQLVEWGETFEPAAP